MISTFEFAKRSTNAWRVSAPCGLSMSKLPWRSRVDELNGVMHQVARDHRLLAPRADQDTDVTGRMTWRREQGDFIGQLVVRGDVVDESRRHDRVDGIVQVLDIVVAAGVAQVHPVVELLPAEQVARLREGGHPAAVHQARVPADVIEMQVRAQHRVDALGREARDREVLQEASS